MHATEFLFKAANAELGDLPGVVACVGKQRALKLRIYARLKLDLLGLDVTEDMLTQLTAASTEWKSIHDELKTISMWSPTRMIILEDADAFVSTYRPQLEAYVDKPAKKSMLVLDVSTMPSNTKLAKLVKDKGLFLECSELTGSALMQYLTKLAMDQYGKRISRQVCELLEQLLGNDLGMLESELAKLASYVGDVKEISTDDVQKMVGGWKTETTWAMLDATRDGNVGKALSCFDQLVTSGEASQKLLGGLVFVFRKYATAASLAIHGNMPLHAAIKTAGIFPRDQKPVEDYLKRIKRDKAQMLLTKVAKADANLKGGSQLPDRVVFEQLILELSGVI